MYTKGRGAKRTRSTPKTNKGAGSMLKRITMVHVVILILAGAVVIQTIQMPRAVPSFRITSHSIKM